MEVMLLLDRSYLKHSLGEGENELEQSRPSLASPIHHTSPPSFFLEKKNTTWHGHSKSVHGQLSPLCVRQMNASSKNNSSINVIIIAIITTTIAPSNKRH